MEYDLTLMFIRLSSNGLSDEPHPRFLVQGHHILSTGGDALLFPHHFTRHPTEHQLCTLGTLWAAASLNWPSSMWRYLIGCVLLGFGHMGAEGCQVCLLPFLFGALLLHQQRTAVSFRSLWSPPGCFQLVVSWLKKLINPLSVFRHISCSFFFKTHHHTLDNTSKLWGLDMQIGGGF